MRRVYLVGSHITPFRGKGHADFIHPKHKDFGKRENPSLKDLIATSVRGALTASNAKATDIEAAWMGNFVGELFCNQGHLGASFCAADPAFKHKPAMRVEGACASGGLAVASAVTAVRAGADVVLAAGVEVQSTATARVGGDYLARASDYARQRKVDDFTFPALLARRTQAYVKAYGEQQWEGIGAVATKAYDAVKANPLGHMNGVKVDATPEGVAKSPCFLGNEELKPYMRLIDCSQVSDGAAAVVLASEEGLRRLGVGKDKCVEVLACAHGAGDLFSDGDMLSFDATAAVAKRAYAEAKIDHTKVDVAEVHDCFTIAEVLMYEALGFAPKGAGASLAASGATRRDGSLPVNCGGGLLAFGHPVGATGVKQIAELQRLILGTAPYATKKKADVGLAANMGGDDKTSVVTIVRRC